MKNPTIFYMTDKYKAILFDFDFTLGDSSSGICDSVNYALGRMDYAPASDADIHKLIGMPLEMMFNKITGSNNADEGIQFKMLFRERAKEVIVKSSTLYENVPQVFIKLQRDGKRLGIVSTKLRMHVQGILDKHECSSYIDLVIGGDDVKQHKPNPEGLLLAMEKLQLKAPEVLYIGDTIFDAEAAEEAGIDFIAVLSGTTEKNAFSRFRFSAILGSVAELLE